VAMGFPISTASHLLSPPIRQGILRLRTIEERGVVHTFQRNLGEEEAIFLTALGLPTDPMTADMRILDGPPELGARDIGRFFYSTKQQT